MNPLIRKELRLILPAWSLAMALAIVPVWAFWPGPGGQLYVPQSPGGVVFIPFGLGVLLLGITPFGGELSLGTFSVLLAQPVTRRRVWMAKTIVLAVALILALVALCISNRLRVDSVLEAMKSTVWQNVFRRPEQPDRLFLNLITETRQAAIRDVWLIGGLSILAAFAGGLWSTLLFRQTSAAFWSTVLVPLGLGLLTAKLLAGFSESIVGIGLSLVLGFYAAGGVLWAWRIFVRVQDLQWTGGVVSFPFRGGRATTSQQLAPERKQKPLRALLHNELQSQYVNLLIAGGLLVFHAAVLICRRLNANYLATHVTAGMILESFPLLWLSVPLLMGSVSIAEERKLGTLENLLCLPTRRRLQFFLKLGTTMGVSVLLGALLPAALEQLASLLGAKANPSGLWVINGSRSIVFLLVVGSMGLSFLAFFASTLTRNTLQALGAGVLVSVLGFLSIAVAVEPPNLGDIILWRGILVGLIGAPVMLLTLIILAYGNYKCLQPDLRTWSRNSLILSAALCSVVGATTAIYHRIWEAWLPPEPTHRFFTSYYAHYPRREHQFPATATIQTTTARVALLVPDGRMWLRHTPVKIQRVQVWDRVTKIPQPHGFWRSSILPGSNWRAVAISDANCFALQADGSLWEISPPAGGGSGDILLRRADEAKNWKFISAAGEHFTGVKSDGTLWEWGQVPTAVGKGIGYKPLAQPTAVGTETNWVATGGNEETSVAVKTDGSIWRWGPFYSSNTNGSLEGHIIDRPEKLLEGPSQQPVSISIHDNTIAIVYDDGTLWLGGYIHLLLAAEKDELSTRQMVPWGKDANWQEVKMYSWNKAVGIKRDGSLWQFHSLSAPWQKGNWLLSRTQPSQYSDWLAVCADRNGYLAFAGDGSLCRWGDPLSEGYFYNEPDPGRLLLPSRIKAKRIASILW